MKVNSDSGDPYFPFISKTLIVDWLMREIVNGLTINLDFWNLFITLSLFIETRRGP